MKIRIKDVFVHDEELRMILDISLRQLIIVTEGIDYSWGDFEKQFQGSLYRFIKELNLQCEFDGGSNDPSDSS